jgi:aspartate carbamoyltransferase catalytic subunit
MKARKDLLDIASLDAEELALVLDSAGPAKEVFHRPVKQAPRLRGKTVLLLFYEPSTRTSTSFEVAAKRLSADVINFPVASSSVQKGESVLDTVETLEAMQVDYIVIRHQRAGIPDLVARHTRASVINAGDGAHAHPTQGLLDAFTLAEVWDRRFAGRRVLIVGDVLHSRVARSTSTALTRLGAEVGVLGPGSLVPAYLPGHLQRFGSWDEAWEWRPDAVYLLRIQKERQSDEFFPSLKEYHRVYGLTEERLREVERRGLWLLHPGPINRGVEMVDRASQYERSLIHRQVENGVAVRMAVLHWLRPEGPAAATEGSPT